MTHDDTPQSRPVPEDDLAPWEAELEQLQNSETGNVRGAAHSDKVELVSTAAKPSVAMIFFTKVTIGEEARYHFRWSVDTLSSAAWGTPGGTQHEGRSLVKAWWRSRDESGNGAPK